MARRHRLAMGDGLGVAVDRVDARVGGGEQGLGVAAAPEGAIDEDRAVARRQRGRHLGEEDGDMRGAHRAAPGGARRARSSCWCASKAAGSQISK